jgi:hypothetical protein
VVHFPHERGYCLTKFKLAHAPAAPAGGIRSRFHAMDPQAAGCRQGWHVRLHRRYGRLVLFPPVGYSPKHLSMIARMGNVFGSAIAARASSPTLCWEKSPSSHQPRAKL